MSITFKQRVAPFSSQQLKALSRILGNTDTGLAGFASNLRC